MNEKLFVTVLMTFLMMFSINVPAQEKNVTLSGEIKGLKKSSIIVYDTETKSELGEGIVSDGSFKVNFRADTKGQKVFCYFSAVDDGEYRTTKAERRFLFVDGTDLKVTGKLRMGGIKNFKQIESITYKQYFECEDHLDKTKYNTLVKKVTALVEEEESCTNAIRKKEYKYKIYQLEEEVIDAEIELYTNLIDKIPVGKTRPGYDAKIFEILQPYRYMFIKPAIDKYIERLGADYFEKSYYANMLLGRCRIVSMYQEGTKIYDVKLRKLDGSYFMLSEYEGKNIYMLLWDMDHDKSGSSVRKLVEFADKLKRKDLVIMVCNISEALGKWADFARRFQHPNIIHVSMDKQKEKADRIPSRRGFGYVYKKKRYPRAVMIGEDQRMIEWNCVRPEQDFFIKKLKKLL